MGDPLARVGVVIVAYASAATLGTCLTALPLARLHGVVVVDNGSPDDSAAVARSVPGVRVLQQENKGFGAGCNVGASALPEADLLLFLNPDAVLLGADLERLVRYLDENESCGLVGPRVVSEGRPVTACGRAPTVATELRVALPSSLARFAPDRRYPPEYSMPGPVGYVEGACMLVRAPEWRDAGRFDERFFLFFEEQDLARRLRLLGRSVDLCPDAVVDHVRAVSRSTFPDAGRTHLWRSSVMYLYKRNVVEAALFRGVFALAMAVRARGGLGPDRAQAWRSAVRDGWRAMRGSAG